MPVIYNALRKFCDVFILGMREIGGMGATICKLNARCLLLSVSQGKPRFKVRRVPAFAGSVNDSASMMLAVQDLFS